MYSTYETPAAVQTAAAAGEAPAVIAEEMGLSYNKVVSRQNSTFKALKEMLGK